MKIKQWIVLGVIVTICINIFGCSNNNKNNYVTQSVKTTNDVSGDDKAEIWKITEGEKSIIIGVVDTGVDISCDILKDKIVNNTYEIKDNNKDDDKNGYTDDNVGWDFFNGDNSIYDKKLYDYHGTYICTNIAQLVPNVSLLPVKFMRGTKGTIEDAIEAVNYAIERGAKIINCSWNLNKYSQELYDIMKENKNIIFVCAAGNSSVNMDEEEIYPCSFNLDNIISVGAVDAKGKMYGASGYGNSVDIMALGVDVDVTVPDNDVTSVSGTSIATSFVSATVALMLALNPKLTAVDIKRTLVDTANPIAKLKGKCLSNGCLNVKEAILKCK